MAFALYDGVTTFGATLHEMAVRVDAGPIVGTLQFPVPLGCHYLCLLAKAHQAALHLFLQAVMVLAHSSEPLSHLPQSWGPRQCRQKDLEEACCLQFDIAAEELERLQNSFGQVPGAEFHLLLHGRRFILSIHKNLKG